MTKNTSSFITISQAVAACSALILTDLFFYYKAQVARDLNIFKENQLMENFQVFLILLAGLAFLQSIAFVEKKLRLLPLAGSLLSFSFTLRELDVEKFNVPRFIAFLFGHGYGRNTLLASLWLMVIIAFVRNRAHYLKIALGLLGRPFGMLAVTGGLLLILGSLFDDQIFNVQLYQFYEELSELNGYYCLLLSSLCLLFDLKRETMPEQSFGVPLQKS